MAWVKTFSEKEATGRLAEVYQEILDHPMSSGLVPNIMKCMGLRPEALTHVWRMNMNITFGASTLGRVREEMIATAVSSINHCKCIHLLNGLYDAKFDGKPVLAITGLHHHDLVNTHSQQDIDLDRVFMDVSVYNARIMADYHGFWGSAVFKKLHDFEFYGIPISSF